MAADAQLAGLGACACFNVRSAARAVTGLYDRTLEPSGLRTTQFAMLSMIAARGGATMQSLAADLGLDPSTMTRTLAPLEKAGLVRAAAGRRDRRVRELVVTARGRRRLAEAGRLWSAAQRRLRERLGSERFERLLGDLGAVVGALRE